MDRLDAIRIFVRVVESGSFSAVARELGVGQPAVSKQVAGLEARLGAQLLRRTSRSLGLTEAGRDFYDSASRVMADLEAAESRVGRSQASPAGLVRVTASQTFSKHYVVPQLPKFLARHPGIDVEMLVSERTSKLVEEGIDVAIRNGVLADSTLVAKKIGMSPVVLVASTAYLETHGEPRTPRDCEEHQGVLFVSQDGPRPWKFGGPRRGATSVLPRSRFRANEGEQMREGVLAGLGLAQVPLWLVQRDLAAGVMRRVLVDHEPEPTPISVVRPAGRRTARRVTVFIEFLAELLAKLPTT